VLVRTLAQKSEDEGGCVLPHSTRVRTGDYAPNPHANHVPSSVPRPSDERVQGSRVSNRRSSYGFPPDTDFPDTSHVVSVSSPVNA